MTQPTGWTITTPPRNSTLATKAVPLTSSGPYKFTVAARYPLDVAAGSVVVFWSKVQAADEVAYGLMYAGYLRYSYTDPAGVAPPITNLQITTAQGINILNRTDHYGIDHHLGMIAATNAGRYTFEHVVYAGSTAYTGNTADVLALRYCDQKPLILTPGADPQVTALQATVADLRADVAELMGRIASLESPA